MSTKSIRLEQELYNSAEIEAERLKRSTSKQVEYWCEIGRLVAHKLSEADIQALANDMASIKVEPSISSSIDVNQIFSEIDEKVKSGNVATILKSGRIYYERSISHPGLIDRVNLDGTRSSGNFKNGVFIELEQ